MAGSRLQLLFLCYRDSGDSLLLKHNGHLSPRGVIQIQYQLKVIPILFSPALQHIYCCAVQLKALPGPGAARRAPACASLPGGFGTLPGGYNVEDEGQSRRGSARLGPARLGRGRRRQQVQRSPAPRPRSAPAGRTFRAPWKVGAPLRSRGGPGADLPQPSPGAAARPPPAGGKAAAAGRALPPLREGGDRSQLRGSRSVRRGRGREQLGVFLIYIFFSPFFLIF